MADVPSFPTLGKDILSRPNESDRFHFGEPYRVSSWQQRFSILEGKPLGVEACWVGNRGAMRYKVIFCWQKLTF